MLPKALILDLDGTLADTEPLHNRAWNDVVRGVPSEVVSQERQKWIGMESVAIARELIARFRLSLSTDEMLREKRRRFREMVRRELKPFPGLAAELERWSGVPMAVATAGSRREALLVLETLRLPVRFDVVVTADDVPRAKPFPDCYLRAAELLGRSPQECVALEDSVHGMLAAVAAGMRVIAISTGRQELPAGVERTFPSAVEALQWLRNGSA
jgi:HAD superfamily hydrolase (TIGR01509 family)